MPHTPTKQGGGGDTHVIQRAIGPDRASGFQVSHLAHDRSDTTRTQPRGTASHKFGEGAEELAFGEGRLERKEVSEDADDHQKFLCRVALHQGEEGRVERIRDFDLVRVLTEEEHAFIDQFADNETQDLAEITTGDQFLFSCMGIVTLSAEVQGCWALASGDVTWAYLKGLFAGLV
jgi:hypothetical protein